MERREIIKERFGQRLTLAIAQRSQTTYSVAHAVSLSAGTISRYCNGLISPKLTTVYALANYLRVNPTWLMGYDEMGMEATGSPAPDNILPISTHPVKLLGAIAAGEPIYADEQIDCYVNNGDERADFCLKIKGDSMIGARIYDGDIVFIKAQPDVEDGEIAAVMIDDEATLKRVYKFGERIQLRAENPAYPPMEYTARDCRNIRILGKAISLQAPIR